MKENLICSILLAIAVLCFIVLAVSYAISGHWILAALYMTVVSLEGYAAYRHFTLWLNIRRMIRNSKSDTE